MRGEEFKEAVGRAFADGGDEGLSAVGEGDKLAHRLDQSFNQGRERGLVAFETRHHRREHRGRSIRSNAKGCPARAASKVR